MRRRPPSEPPHPPEGVDPELVELEERVRARAVLESSGLRSSLLDFVPAMNRRYRRPEHLAPVADLYHRIARGERVRAVVSAPPRHAKTELNLFGIAWLLWQYPALQACFASYAGNFSRKNSRKIRRLVRRAGISLSEEASNVLDWRTGVEEGGLSATSIGGQMTGEGYHLMVIDDPIRDRKTAESPRARDDHWEWMTEVAYTRLEGDIGSCIVNATRWHEDDLSGRLIAEGWEWINLPAIADEHGQPADEGRALCPWRFDVAQLREIRKTIGEYGWWSLYQGLPRPRGAKVFRDKHEYAALPVDGLRKGLGLDFAYTASKRADYSVVIAGARVGHKLYILDVWRNQVETTRHAEQARRIQREHGGALGHAYIGPGGEKGVVTFMQREGVRIAALPAVGDKFTRAQPVAAAWNRGDVLVPGDAPWLDDFLDEINGFSGVKDRNDDQVDALAALYDGLFGAHTAALSADEITCLAPPRPGQTAPAGEAPGPVLPPFGRSGRGSLFGGRR